MATYNLPGLRALDDFPNDYFVINQIAKDYADLTFPVTAGTYCNHNGTIYKASTDIQSSEEWTAAHWEAVHIADEVATNKAAQDSEIQALSEDVESALATKANVDGYYANLGAGTAEQLVSSMYEEDKVPYAFRSSGGSADIGNREKDMLVGGTLCWNQITNNGNFASKSGWSEINCTLTVSNNIGSFTGTAQSSGIRRSTSVTKDHVYLAVADLKITSGTARIKWDGAGGGVTSITGAFETVACVCKAGATNATWSYPRILDDRASDWDAVQVRNAMVIDLTKMFGAAVADYVYSLDNSAALAWWKKLFPKGYYAYDTGTLLSVNASSHDTVGFNAFDASAKEDNKAFRWTDGGTLSESGSVVSGYIPVVPGAEYYTNYKAQVLFYDSNKAYIGNPANSGFNTFTPPYGAAYVRLGWRTSYNSSADMTEKTDICVNLSWSGYRNGEYEPYVKHSYPLDSSLTLRGIPKLDANNKLYYDGDTYESDGTVTRRCGTRAYTSGDESDSTVITDGTNTVYPLSTPTTETATAYQNRQIVDDFGTEEYVVTEQGGVAVPVGHTTQYMANLRDKLQHLPDLASADGTYVISQSNEQMTLVPLTTPAELPAAPATDGTYTLKVTVSGGTPTYSWGS